MPHYWSNEIIEPAIIAYNAESDKEKRNAIYEGQLHIPCSKLVEFVCNTFRQTCLTDDFARIQQDALTHLVRCLHCFDKTKGAGHSFGYFSLCVRNYLIQLNNAKYKEWKRTDSIDDNTDSEQGVPTNDLPAPEQNKDLQEFIELILKWFTDKRIEEIFAKCSRPTHDRYVSIARELLKCFKEFPSSLLAEKQIRDNSIRLVNKHISSVLGLPDCTCHLVKVRRKLSPYIKQMYKHYIETGDIETAEKEQQPITTTIIRRITWVNGVKTITESEGPRSIPMKEAPKTESIVGVTHPYNISKRNIFNEQQIIEIRKRYAEGNINVSNLAKEYNVSDAVISKIINYKSYRHLQSEDYLREKIEQRKQYWKKHAHSKLNEEQVREIVNKASSALYSQVAKEYEVSRTTIAAIMNGEHWSNITGIKSKQPKTETVVVMDMGGKTNEWKNNT